MTGIIIYFLILNILIVLMIAHNCSLVREKYSTEEKIKLLCKAYEKQILERDKCLNKILQS